MDDNIKTCEDLSDKIRFLHINMRRRADVNDDIKKLEMERDEINKNIENAVEHADDLRAYISELLCASLDLKMDKDSVEAFKEAHPVKYSECKWSTVGPDSEIKSEISKTQEDDSSYFHPLLDKWELRDVKCRLNEHTGVEECEFVVECMKQRRYVNPFMWEPSLYSTGWIDIS